MMNDLSGFLLINKPAGISSYDCIRHIKKIIGKNIKISHMGTLDPFASGLLIIGISNQATKKSKKFLTLEKEYKAIGKLGELTDTLDYTGNVLRICNTNITEQDIKLAISTLIPGYNQVPAIFSALKFQGEPLYKLARSKKFSLEELEKIVSLKAKYINIYKLELESYTPPYFTIQTQVSHGTYIRSLVNDIAKKAGSCAITYELIRTKIGTYSIDQSVELHSLNNIDDIKNNLFNP